MIYNSKQYYQFLPNSIFYKHYYLCEIITIFNFIIPKFSNQKYSHFMTYKNHDGHYNSEFL